MRTQKELGMYRDYKVDMISGATEAVSDLQLKTFTNGIYADDAEEKQRKLRE